MPRKTLGPPTAADSFLWRICKALDEPPDLLAKNLGVPYKELEPLLDTRHLLAEMDRDDVWWRLMEYVDRRIGTMLSVRSELNRALQRDRQKRAVRIAAMTQRERKGSPRARRQDDGDTDV